MIAKLRTAPDLPGVYMFFDKNGKVIYVGKAKSLRNRLMGHIKCTDPGNKSYQIVKNAADFDFIVVRNEREALITEASLIKKHLPKFNAVFKDDKSYPFLLISDDEFPGIYIIRDTDKKRYPGVKFGPFSPVKNARVMKDLICRVFRLRTCKTFRRKEYPCIQYHMGRCTAPCCGFVDRETYLKQVEGVISFLKGDVKRYIDDLYSEIEEASSRFEFERAATLRDQLISLKAVYEMNSVLFDKYSNCDIYYLESEGCSFKGVKLTVRGGIIYGKRKYAFSPIEVSDESVCNLISKSTAGTMWIMNTFSSEDPPQVILSNFDVLKDVGVVVEPIPDELLYLVRLNVSRDTLINVSLEELAHEFEKILGIPLPHRVEAIDISTLYGFGTVGSCIVWESGELKKSDYKRYRIRNVNGVDDYASLKEVLERRYAKDCTDVPDMVLIDGGLGHLNVALEIKGGLGIETFFSSIAKREEILYTQNGEVIKLKNFSNLFKFFTQLRDEAHRFAIGYNRLLRSKQLKEGLFDGIKGLGRRRKEKLYRMYPDLRELMHVSPRELAKIGIPVSVAYRIIERVKDRYGG